MGSGMLPCGAYVTLEHEWILIFRKGDKRIFKSANEKLVRMKSSFFWEERNVWFQMYGISRERSRIYKNRKQEKEVQLSHLRFHTD